MNPITKEYLYNQQGNFHIFISLEKFVIKAKRQQWHDHQKKVYSAITLTFLRENKNITQIDSIWHV